VIPSADSAVEVRGAHKTFPNGTRALDPVDLALREGEFTTVVGPSGCGKSTLFNLIVGVFQSPTLMPWADVQANVRLPLDLGGTLRSEAERKVRRALDLVGLADFGRAYPRELSGGMQMRVSIARALVTGARLLLMDEPFGALDEITRHRLDRELSALCAREGLTVLFVTHSIYEAVFLSSRVLVMSSRPGRIHAEVVIDAPQPREPAFRNSTQFLAHNAKLAELLAEAMQEAPA
jgi:NitT/TauT family transport system ATP-binding protein